MVPCYALPATFSSIWLHRIVSVSEQSCAVDRCKRRGEASAAAVQAAAHKGQCASVSLPAVCGAGQCGAALHPSLLLTGKFLLNP